jgi:hypothetical protein
VLGDGSAAAAITTQASQCAATYKSFVVHVLWHRITPLLWRLCRRHSATVWWLRGSRITVLLAVRFGA